MDCSSLLMRIRILVILIFVSCITNSCLLLLNTASSRTKTLNFPSDHLHHPGLMTEWWYFNGHLQGADHRTFSYGFCLFRVSPLRYFVHLSLTDHQSDEFIFYRGTYLPGKIKTDKKKQLISYANEQVVAVDENGNFQLEGLGDNISIHLKLTSLKQPMLVNGNAWIDMPEGKGSSYYSLTRLETSGHINLNGINFPVKGLSWMDHQWGNFLVVEKGWDWFSMQLNDSTEYNLYSFRNRSGKILYQYVNILDKNNTLSSFRNFEFNRLAAWESKVTGKQYTTNWQVVIPAIKDTFYLAALKEKQELFSTSDRDIMPSYWEGACAVEKHTPDGRVVFGKAFSEHFPVSPGK